MEGYAYSNAPAAAGAGAAAPQTENGARSLEGSGETVVDLFFKTVRGIAEVLLLRLLAASWATSPLLTLRMIFYIRDCRGGKGEKEIFYKSIEWLWTIDPASVRANLCHVPFYGTWKDLLELACRIPALKDQVCHMFADQLRADLASLREHRPVSLAAKWAPTEGHSFDKRGRFYRSICRILGVSTREMRVQYLTPLRRHMEVVERLMCAGKWDEIPYAGVPSRAMHILKKAFRRHDEMRYDQFLAAVREGSATIKARQLMPHELAAAYMRGSPRDETVELQWLEVLRGMDELGDFDKALVLSDVSGSMGGTPMEVSIALGIAISSKSFGPFRDRVLTFESSPRLVHLRSESLHGKVRELAAAPWGGSTNIQAALELGLETAIMYDVPPESMPERLYVISDMQFNQADRGNTMNNYEMLRARYAEAGYEVPHIVFWNVRANTRDCPANAYQDKVSLISGFSPSVLKAVLEGNLGSTPLDTVLTALSDERYARIELAPVEVPEEHPEEESDDEV